MKPKILYVIDNLEFGGGERVLAHRLGQGGRKFVEERFTISRRSAEVDRFYTALLKKKRVVGLGK